MFTTGTWASCYFAEEKAHHIIKFLNAFHKIAVIIVHHAPQLCSANRFPKLGKKRKKTKENKTICDSATEKPKPKPVDQNCILVQPFVHACWICNQILKCLCKISMQISSSNLLHIQFRTHNFRDRICIANQVFFRQLCKAHDRQHQRFAVYTIFIPDIHTYIHTSTYKIWQLFTKAERGTRMTQLPPLPACLLAWF